MSKLGEKIQNRGCVFTFFVKHEKWSFSFTSQSSSDSSDDDGMDDLELLLLQNVFSGREFDVHLNFEGKSKDDFPSLFR